MLVSHVKRISVAVAVAAAFVVSGHVSAQERPSPDGQPFGQRKAEPRAPEGRPGDPRSGEAKPADPRGGAPGAKDSKAIGPKGEGKKAEAPKPIPRSMRKPGSPAIPEGGTARAALLADLYAYLATSTDEEVAKQTANAIEHVWHAAGSETMQLLLERASRASKDKKPALAMKLYEQAIQLAPDNPEVFAHRAMAFYNENDFKSAMGDLRRVLALEPNHFKALDGLGTILKEAGSKKAALEVYRKLHQVHPFFPGAKSTLDELQREVEGQAS